jgi:hypothetical protein
MFELPQVTDVSREPLDPSNVRLQPHRHMITPAVVDRKPMSGR